MAERPPGGERPAALGEALDPDVARPLAKNPRAADRRSSEEIGDLRLGVRGADGGLEEAAHRPAVSAPVPRDVERENGAVRAAEVAHEERAARSEDAGDLVERREGRGEVMQDRVAEDEIESSARQPEALRIADEKADLRVEARVARGSARFRDHSRRGVDAEHGEARSAEREEERDRPGTAAEVESAPLANAERERARHAALVEAREVCLGGRIGVRGDLVVGVHELRLGNALAVQHGASIPSTPDGAGRCGPVRGPRPIV